MEYAVFNNDETTLSLFPYNLFGGESCSVGTDQLCVGFRYTNTEMFPLFGFNKLSINFTSSLLSSSIVNLMF